MDPIDRLVWQALPQEVRQHIAHAFRIATSKPVCCWLVCGWDGAAVHHDVPTTPQFGSITITAPVAGARTIPYEPAPAASPSSDIPQSPPKRRFPRRVEVDGAVASSSQEHNKRRRQTNNVKRVDVVQGRHAW